MALFFCCWYFKGLPEYFPIDDSYIILTYARNVIECGELFSYNQGTLSTGITSPLYCLSLVAANIFTGNLPDAVYFIGFIAFLVSLVAGSWWVWIISGEGRQGHIASILFSVFWGCWGYIHFFTFCGMEPILYIALSFLALCFYSKQKHFLTGLVLGLAALCRPEAVFLAFLLGLPYVISFVSGLLKKDYKETKNTVISGLKLLGGFFLLYGIWAARCLQVSGSIFSSTVALKSGAEYFGLENYARCFLTMLPVDAYDYNVMSTVLPDTPWMALRRWCPVSLLSLGCIFFCKGGITNYRAWLPVMYPLVHFAGTVLKNNVCNDNIRYHVLDFSIVMACMAVFIAWLITSPSVKNKVLFGFRNYAGVYLAALLVGLVVNDHFYQKTMYSVMSSYFYALDYSIGKWLAANTPPGTAVAHFQAGGIKYFGNCRTIDLGAVTDHTVIPYLQGKNGLDLEDLLVARRADYIAPMGEDWAEQHGIHIRDSRYYEPVFMHSRHLYKINKAALREAVIKSNLGR